MSSHDIFRYNYIIIIIIIKTVIFEYRKENESTKERLTNLERRCRELLLYQGAAISSASVALSGLSSRFEQLLDQLYTLYSISDADLQVSVLLRYSVGPRKKKKKGKIEHIKLVCPQ